MNSGIFVEHLNTLDFSTLISEACMVYVKLEPIQPVCGLEIMGKVEISVKMQPFSISIESSEKPALRKN